MRVSAGSNLAIILLPQAIRSLFGRWGKEADGPDRRTGAKIDK
jgi:hypothetical protein